jgi:ubiquinone biosynthesis protein UbiJ
MIEEDKKAVTLRRFIREITTLQDEISTLKKRIKNLEEQKIISHCADSYHDQCSIV